MYCYPASSRTFHPSTGSSCAGQRSLPIAKIVTGESTFIFISQQQTISSCSLCYVSFVSLICVFVFVIKIKKENKCLFMRIDLLEAMFICCKQCKFLDCWFAEGHFLRIWAFWNVNKATSTLLADSEHNAFLSYRREMFFHTSIREFAYQ